MYDVTQYIYSLSGAQPEEASAAQLSCFLTWACISPFCVSGDFESRPLLANLCDEETNIFTYCLRQGLVRKMQVFPIISTLQWCVCCQSLFRSRYALDLLRRLTVHCSNRFLHFPTRRPRNILRPRLKQEPRAD